MYFPKCRICGSEELLTRLAWDEEADKGKVSSKEIEVSANKLATPLFDIKKPPLTLTVNAIARHFDTCGGCGIERCVKAEIIAVPISMQQAPGQGHPGRPFN